jgi:hypothetical protein
MTSLTSQSQKVNEKKDAAQKTKAALEVKSAEAMEQKSFVEGKLAKA